MKHKPRNDCQEEEFLSEKQIKDIEKKLADKYFHLGKEINDKLYPKITEINELVDQLTAAKTQFLSSKGMIICEHCLKPNHADKQLCEKCGCKLNTENKSKKE